MDLTSVDVRRFSPYAADETWLRSRVAEILGLHYAVPWPNREPETARDVRLSPLHQRVAAAGATFGTRNGWERPLYFGPPLDYGWGKPGLARAQRRRAGGLPYGGRGLRPDVVQQVPSSAVPTRSPRCSGSAPPTSTCPSGHAVYTPWLNARGAYESDVTVTRTGDASSSSSRVPPRPCATWPGSTSTSRDGAEVEVADRSGDSPCSA